MMKLNKLIASLLCATAIVAHGRDWYVDANNGNDLWDGTTAAIPTQEQIDAIAVGDSIPGPRRTLHAMMSDEKVGVGDTVWAAEGDYNEGGTVYGTYKTVNRVQVKAGVTLRASGSRDNTFITGSGGDTTKAYTNGSARCVYFLTKPSGVDCGGGIVKGFTLRDGRTCPKYQNSENPEKYIEEQGGASTDNGLLVDCILSNNGCGPSSRGGTMYKGTALRCYFGSTHQGCLAYSPSVIIDSLISDSAYLYSGCNTYNCTFIGEAYLRACNSFNCLFIGSGTSSKKQNNGGDKSNHYNTFSRSTFDLDTCIQEEGSRVVTEGETPYDSETYRPLAGSVAIDSGDPAKYALATNGWKQAWLEECGKDYYGEERVVNGRIDVGCGEAQGSNITVEDSSTGLVTEGMNAGNLRVPDGSSIDVTFSRNFTSDKLCVGVKVNGEFYSFGGTTSDVPCTVTFPATPALDYSVVAVYEEDQKHWYVNPKGDDANPGYHIKCPRKTLDKAMELAKENAEHIVHAASGTYDKFSEGNTASNRVTVKEGVGLVADEWPLKKTIIVGASDTSTEADGNGNGPGAVRCVLVRSGGYVRGFKLAGGRTAKGTGTSARGGGAYLIGGAVIDCEITDTGCAHRGRAVYASDTASVILRCHIHDTVCGSYDVYNGVLVNSYAVGNGDSNYFTYYGSGRILNSCVLGGHARSGSENFTVRNSYLKLVSAAGSSKIYCTNCVFTSSRNGAVATESKDYSFLDEATCRFSAPKADNMDENFRPKNNASPLVDAGSRELYDKYFPSKWVQFKEGDLKGGQRIYNAKIDVGCGEYDWRGDYASKVNSKVEVASADPDTVLVEQGIDIKAGDTLRLRVKLHAGGTVSLNISGGATVMVDGAEIEGVAGVYAFGGEKGAVCEIAVSAGEAGAVLSSVSLPKHGTVVVVR